MSAVQQSALATFAAQLHAWRKRLGWSQAQLAGKLLCSDSLVSGVETMNKTPTLDFATRLDEVFGTPDTFVAFHELISRDELRSREVWPSYFTPVIDFETRAVRIHDWELRVIPGVLQTEDYARSVFSAGRTRLSADALDRRVSARLERQQILTRDNPPMYWTVLHEGTLRHMVGSQAIMAGQLDKIIELTRMPNVVIQVLPFTASDHPGSDGPIVVFDFADATSVAYTEYSGGGVIINSPVQVAELMTTLSLIRAAALPQRESLNLLTQIRSGLGDD